MSALLYRIDDSKQKPVMGINPLLYEPDAAVEAARAAQIEHLLAMSRRRRAALDPGLDTAAAELLPPLRISIVAASDLPPLQHSAPTLGQKAADGSMRLDYGTRAEDTLPASTFQGHTCAVLLDTQLALTSVVSAALTAGAEAVKVFPTGSDILALHTEPQAPHRGAAGFGARLDSTDTAILKQPGSVTGGEMFDSLAEREVHAVQAEVSQGKQVHKQSFRCLRFLVLF